MLSNRPYLLRSFYQWITDSSCTPILVIDANNPRCKIPQDYAEGGEIVFNISNAAVRDLKMTNEHIEFKASFSGVIHMIFAPVKAVLAIYAEENGEGIFFDAEGDDTSDSDGTSNFREDDLIQLKGIDGTGVQSIDDRGSRETTAKSKPFLKLVE